MREERPWGSYEVLYDGVVCKVKKIVVKPGQSLSYQYHNKRSEHWTIVAGEGKLRLDGEVKEVMAGTSVFIPTTSKHSILNSSTDDLIFIEVQTGTYFGEDDIVRLEDMYGRVK